MVFVFDFIIFIVVSVLGINGQIYKGYIVYVSHLESFFWMLMITCYVLYLFLVGLLFRALLSNALVIFLRCLYHGSQLF